MAIYRVPINITYSGAGGPGVNVWHVRAGSYVTDPAGLQGVVNIIHTFYDAIKAYVPQGMSWSIGTVTDVATSEEATPTFAPVVGGSLSGYAPQALALVVTWKTQVAARRGRGRTFLGPMALSMVSTNGTPDDTFLTAIRNAAAALVTSSKASLNGAVVVWGLENPQGASPGPVSALPHLARDVVGSSVRDLFGVMRSRRD